MLLLEVIDELLERQLALDLEPVPQRPLLVVVVQLRRRYRLGEPEERQRQIDETVLERRQRVESLRQLDQLEAGEPGDDRRCRGDGRDDLPGDELRLVTVGGRDFIVRRSEVRRGNDVVHVEVRVVVFFKLERRYFHLRQFRQRREVLLDLIDAVVVGISAVVDLHLRIGHGDLYARFRNKLRHLKSIVSIYFPLKGVAFISTYVDFLNHLGDRFSIAILRNSVNLGFQVRSSPDVVEMQRFVHAEGNRFGTPFRAGPERLPAARQLIRREIIQ